MRFLRRAPTQASTATVSLARALSKLGYCSRTQAEKLVREGRVAVDGRIVRQVELRIDPQRARLAVDDRPVTAARRIYLMLNKPRGMVTTANDPEGRQTVYACLGGLNLPHLAPVGRLDMASEGLLLMTNDTRWAQRILDPASGVDKTYHVQIDRIPDDAFMARLREGAVDGDEVLSIRSAALLRCGERNAWVEMVIDEGRNRQVRRIVAAAGAEVLRLVRVRIGELALGDLAKGAIRELAPEEMALPLAGHPADTSHVDAG